jgi:hypothetical protein
MERTAAATGLQASRSTRFAFGFALVAAVVYWLATNHVWEDYLITFRHSRNLAEGRGLVFQPGERVHGFTSPLGVLLPAAFHVALGNPESFSPALLCFRICGAAAFAGGIFFAVRTMTRAGVGGWAFAAAAVLVLEIKGVSFAVNGQETGFMILFLGWSMDLLSQPGPVRWGSLAVAWAGLQWTRPDGFVIGGAWALARLLFANGDERRDLLVVYLKAAGLSLALYVPWLGFTTAIYGTPVPHTVIAKSAVAENPTTALEWWNRFADRVGWILQPTCFFLGGWPPWVARFARAIAFAGLVVWMIPGRGETLQLARRSSIAFLLLVGYFCFIPLSAWYIPPAAMLLLVAMSASVVSRPIPTLAIVLLGYTAAVLVEENRWRIGHSLQNALLICGGLLLIAAWKAPNWIPRAVGFAGLTAFLGAVFGMSTLQIRHQQEIVENGCRTQVGEWLKQHVGRDETVFLECLGYIGYHSNCLMLDFPGLASPKVAQAHRVRSWPKGMEPVKRMLSLIPDLKPDWVVLRPHELATAEGLKVLTDYRERHRIDVGPIIDQQCPNLPGVGYLRVDSCFIVFQRISAGDS